MRLRDPWGGPRGLPRDVWVVAGTTLADRMGTRAATLLVPYLPEHHGFAVATAGRVLSAFGVDSHVHGVAALPAA